MKSNYIKACLSAYFRFKNRCDIMATEVGKFNSDFLIIRGDNLIEIEIKTSKSDLLNDFKKPKHKLYKLGKSPWTPRYFYFAVPQELIEYACTKSLDNGYGVITIDNSQKRFCDKVHVVKRPKRIHNNKLSSKLNQIILNRLMSEMANLRIKAETINS